MKSEKGRIIIDDFARSRVDSNRPDGLRKRPQRDVF